MKAASDPATISIRIVDDDERASPLCARIGRLEGHGGPFEPAPKRLGASH